METHKNALFLSQTLQMDGVLSAPIRSFQIDSRLVEEGDCFFALEGYKTDGHRYLRDVAEKGAAVAVVSQRYQGIDFGMTLFRVPDVLEAMRLFAKASMESFRGKIVGVTGSVGKTTTKDFIATLLEGKFVVGKTIGSQNAQRTFPLALLNRRGDEEVMVLEMGMSNPGEIARLVELAPPHVAIITAIGMAHISAFDEGISGIAAEKSSIFRSKNLESALFDPSFVPFSFLLEGVQAKKWLFSLEEKEADYFLSVGEDGIVIDERGIRAAKWQVPFEKSHFLHDLLGAIAVCRQLGMSFEEMETRLPHLKVPKMRFEESLFCDVLFINDAYNSNPSSLEAALLAIPKPNHGGKRIGVLGPMGDMGPFSIEMHAALGKKAIERIDHLLAFDDETKPLAEAFMASQKPSEWFSSKEEMARRLIELIRPHDVVLVKGRRSSEMETVLEMAHVALSP